MCSASITYGGYSSFLIERNIEQARIGRTDMKRSPLIRIDCAQENWRTLLKRNLQDEIEVDLENLDYETCGEFCELLAVSHSMSFRLDARNRVGKFRNPPPLVPMPMPSQNV